MFDITQFTENLNFILVFVAGLVSFFSPCIIPILPVFMAVLAGDVDPDNEKNNRRRLLINTLMFVLGISITFFLLGLAINELRDVLIKNQLLATRIGGIIIIFFGLIQIGFLEFEVLKREYKFNFQFKNSSPIKSFMLGFIFSFAWTPCIGPILTSILILSSSSQTTVVGNLFIVAYTLGFVIPFILLAIFASKFINLIRNKNYLKYTTKIGGVILIIIGLMMYTGYLNTYSEYLNYSNPTEEIEPMKIDFSLLDQHGETHTLSEYEGKTVFINFFATKCGPCRAEIPHIQEIYEEYGYNSEDVIILTIANPGGYLEGTTDEIYEFVENKGIDFPVLFDNTGQVFYDYYVNVFPTTYMIDSEGYIFGYLNGSMSKEIMVNIIEQTIGSSYK